MHDITNLMGIMLMKGIMKLKDEELDPLFWDCECEKNYIHPKTHAMCPYCGAWAKDQPDSRVEEVEKMLKERQVRLLHIRSEE